jgi:hypothetical protein
VSTHYERQAQVRAAAVILFALAGVGAALGIAWQAWSPPGPFGIIYGDGTQPDETETFAAADGRFAIIVGAVGLIAGIGVWLLRRARGPYVVLALGAGGIGGAALTWWVGHLIRGKAHTFACYPASGKAACTDHLPLTLHMVGLLYLEPAIAILGYGLLVAFAHHDDLGRPDPMRDRLLVRAADQGDDRWSYGDRAGMPEQPDLPTQHPMQPGEPFGGGFDVKQ